MIRSLYHISMGLVQRLLPAWSHTFFFHEHLYVPHVLRQLL